MITGPDGDLHTSKKAEIDEPQAGWYADPSAPGGVRWWDGQRWTEHLREGSVPEAAGQPGAERSRLVTTRRLVVLGLVLGAAGIVAIVGIKSSDDGNGASPSPTVTTPHDQQLAAVERRLVRLRRQSEQGVDAGAPPGDERMPPASATTEAEAQQSASGAPDPSALAGVDINPRLIPFGQDRKQQMAAYSERHYGDPEWRLTDPKLIVLHYTAGGTAESTIEAFAANTPNNGELPGTCAHFLIDQDGTIYQLVPLSVRCRHAIGLNDTAIGIEMVQDATPDAIDQIFARPKQINAAVDLVSALMKSYGLPTSHVIGHGMANESPYFHDLEGWTNDHTDWLEPDVARFRSMLP